MSASINSIQSSSSKALICLLALALIATGCNLWNVQEAEATAINIWKHRYPFYGGGYGYYPFWGGYGGGYGGYGGVGISLGGIGGGYGRR